MTMNTDTVTPLVFSDLDGSLLDHHSYSFAEALPAVNALTRLNIPLILASSKTRAEIIALRQALGNRAPFIVENGAAVFVPRDCFARQPPETTQQGDYWVHELAPPRARWLAELAALREEFGEEFTGFSDAGVTGIMAMTGLSAEQAAAANDRGYSEPVKWHGGCEQELQFVARLREAGATVAKGGRFLGITGNCDKGQALVWLRAQFQSAAPGQRIVDLAIGDSGNDVPMLEASQSALLIRSPVQGFPVLKRQEQVIRSSSFGPAGWAEGVSVWLQQNNFIE